MARRLPSPSEAARLAAYDGDLDEELGWVLLRWEVSATHSTQTLVRMTETVQRFTRRLSATGIRSFTRVTPGHAAAFVRAPLPDGSLPEIHTQHARRTALRVLFRTLRALDVPLGDPTLDLVLPPRGSRVARPLTPEEVTLCRASAQATPGRRKLMRAVAWSLGEASAVSSEITAVRVRDLDRGDGLTLPGTVTLPGTRRLRPRTVPLTDWGSQIIAQRLVDLRRRDRLHPDALLAYGGLTPPGGAKAQASVCNALRDVLDAAGLAGECDVRPSSLRHWAGRTAYDNGSSIQTVARLMGHRSLDAAAEDIALDWAPDIDAGTGVA